MVIKTRRRGGLSYPLGGIAQAFKAQPSLHADAGVRDCCTCFMACDSRLAASALPGLVRRR